MDKVKYVMELTRLGIIKTVCNVQLRINKLDILDCPCPKGHKLGFK